MEDLMNLQTLLMICLLNSGCESLIGKSWNRKLEDMRREGLSVRILFQTKNTGNLLKLRVNRKVHLNRKLLNLLHKKIWNNFKLHNSTRIPLPVFQQKVYPNLTPGVELSSHQKKTSEAKKKQQYRKLLNNGEIYNNPLHRLVRKNLSPHRLHLHKSPLSLLFHPLFLLLLSLLSHLFVILNLFQDLIQRFRN